MVAFDANAGTEHPFDWTIVQNSSVSLCSDHAWLDATLGRLDELGYQIVQFDSGAWSNGEGMYRDFHKTLKFPQYVPNLDGLNDFFDDLAAWYWGADCAATGLALVFWHYDAFAAKEPRVAYGVLDAFALAARNGALLGHRMVCLVHTDDPGLSFPPVGATEVREASGWPWPIDDEG